MKQHDPQVGRQHRTTQRGRHRINDGARLDELIRLFVRDPSKTLWEHITELVQRDERVGRQSEKAEIYRLNNKYRRQQYDPERARVAPLRAQELQKEGFIQECQFLVDQNSADWSDMGRKGYFPVGRMADGRWKVQRHLRGLLTHDELCAECAPYFASIAHLWDQCLIDDDMQAVEPDENPL